LLVTGYGCHACCAWHAEILRWYLDIHFISFYIISGISYTYIYKLYIYKLTGFQIKRFFGLLCRWHVDLQLALQLMQDTALNSQVYFIGKAVKPKGWVPAQGPFCFTRRRFLGCLFLPQQSCYMHYIDLHSVYIYNYIYMYMTCTYT
jgi:hypothetical protein